MMALLSPVMVEVLEMVHVSDWQWAVVMRYYFKIETSGKQDGGIR